MGDDRDWTRRCGELVPGDVLGEVAGRTHRLSINPDVMSEAADWMDRQRALWGRLFDVVDEYLKEDKPK